VGKADGSRECAPGDVPTIVPRLKMVGKRLSDAFAHPVVIEAGVSAFYAEAVSG
jgi:hypothetical protein